MSQINVDIINPQSGPDVTMTGGVVLNLTNAASLATDGSGKIFSPYKSYVAKITQLTTANPTASVYENTLGGTIVWTRQSVGSYRGTLSSAFSSGKVHLLFNNPLSTNKVYFYNASDPNIVYIDCVDNAGSPADYNGDSLDIQIKVYP